MDPWYSLYGDVDMAREAYYNELYLSRSDPEHVSSVDYCREMYQEARKAAQRNK